MSHHPHTPDLETNIGFIIWLITRGGALLLNIALEVAPGYLVVFLFRLDTGLTVFFAWVVIVIALVGLLSIVLFLRHSIQIIRTMHHYNNP